MAMAAPETVVAADRALSPATVICAPLYGSAGHLSRTLESLTGQSCADFALVLVDDRSPDHTLEVARAFAERDPRISLFRNPERLGMLRNTALAHRLGRRLHPGADYLAYASDHDVWDPRWLARLRAELEAAPQTVLVYPRVSLIAENGDEAPSRTRDFDTRGERDPRARFHAVSRRVVAGDMIYGLFRTAALDRVGPYRRVLMPDRLLLAELALHGEFRQVPEYLWSRRLPRTMSLERQRAAFFPDGGGLDTRVVPWWIAHAGAVGWRYGVVDGRPLGRASALALAVDYVRRPAGRTRPGRALRGLRNEARRRRRSARRAVRRRTRRLTRRLRRRVARLGRRLLRR
jgi:hypothetical protein